MENKILTEKEVLEAVQPKIVRIGDLADICDQVKMIDKKNKPLRWICLALNGASLGAGIGPIQHENCPRKREYSKACEKLRL